MTSYKKFIKDVGFVGITQIVSALKGLILLPILTKTLGAEIYGTWAMIIATVSLLMPLGLLQLEYAMTRFLTAEKNKIKINEGISSIFVTVMLTASSISMIIFIMSEPLAVVIFGGIGNIIFVKITSLLILLTTLDQAILQYFISFRRMERYSGFVILQTIIEVLLIGYLVLSGYGLFGAVSSLLLVRAVIVIVGFLLIKSEVGLVTPSFSVIKPYLAFSLPLIPFTFSWLMIDIGDRYVIGYFLGVNAVGIYSVSYAIGSLVVFFCSPIILLLLPALTNLYENEEIEELKNSLKYAFKFFVAISTPTLIGLSILSKSLLVMLSTPEFLSGYTIVPIVGLGVIFFNIDKLFANVLILFKKTKVLSLAYGFSALLNMIMNIILVPMIGILGAAIATLITFVILSFMLGFISFKMLSFDLDVKFIAKSMLSSTMMGYVIWWLNPIGTVNIVISILIAAIVYSGVLFVLKGFTKKEYMYMKNIAKAVVQKI